MSIAKHGYPAGITYEGNNLSQPLHFVGTVPILVNMKNDFDKNYCELFFGSVFYPNVNNKIILTLCNVSRNGELRSNHSYLVICTLWTGLQMFEG